MSTKYIHYCWFGGKPLPKLAKKCIKSWKKYLPDFKIIEWNENNVDLEECPFVKEAYDNKKWAFVADYVRTKALYEMGGIYFDTDMEITKNIDELLNNITFLGIEDSGKIAVGVWYEKKAKAFLPKNMLEFYNNLSGFDSDNSYTYTIPNIITSIVNDSSFVMGKTSIQKLKNNITIYPRDYFYPLSYDRQNNIFTENTCMIHYYDASWVPKGEKKLNAFLKIFGKDVGMDAFDFLRYGKYCVVKGIKLLLFPIFKKKKKKQNNINLCNRKQSFDLEMQNISEEQVIAIYRKDWLGTSNATKELFENCVGIYDVEDGEIRDYYCKKILEKKPKMVIFSAFDFTWAEIIKQMKTNNENIIIKVLWHGSNAVNTEDYDWKVLKTILEFDKYGLIDSIGFVKKSMYEFYKNRGYDCEFVMNTVNLSNKSFKKDKTKSKNDKIKIGIYASGDRWVKNFYNQLSAASMIDNHLIDCIPLSSKTTEFANMIDANIIGEKKSIPREQMIERLSTNDINVYATFVECAPILPLESLEMGVPCITSDNHHYWKGTKLEKYLVVSAPDNIIEIKDKIEFALKNKDKIIELYREWKTKYDKDAKRSVEEFIKE